MSRYPQASSPSSTFTSKNESCACIFLLSLQVRVCFSCFRYIYKGPDQAEIETILKDVEGEVTGGILDHDEIHHYVLARYLSSCEAVSSAMGDVVSVLSHHVFRLDVHLPGDFNVVFEEGKEEKALERTTFKTSLTAFFNLNRGLDVSTEVRDLARSLLYAEIPTKFRYIPKTKTWEPRFSRAKDFQYPVSSRETNNLKRVIGRMPSIQPTAVEFEKYCLMLLLLHMKGPTGFESLKTSDNGVVFDTFAAACIDRGLLGTDLEWDRALRAARVYQFPIQLRQLFCTILVFCQPADPLKLWQDHKRWLWNDRQTDAEYAANEVQCDFMAYHRVQSLIQETHPEHTLAKNYGIPEPLGQWPADADASPADRAHHKTTGQEMYAKLSSEQKVIVDDILDSVHTGAGKRFFLSGVAGSGKTFAYTTLYHIIMGEQTDDCSEGDDVYCMASTGIAATLLPNGVTYHKRMGGPLDTTGPAISLFSFQSKEARKLARCKLFIFDESTMSHKANMECMDASLRDFRKDERPFGGATVVFGGDFRQTLPIVLRGTAAMQVAACIRMSPLWNQFDLRVLEKNLRVHVDEDSNTYAKFVLDVGNGVDKRDITEFPPRVHIMYKHMDLIRAVYGDVIDESTISKQYSRAIVSPTNRNTRKFNDIIINDLMPGEALVCDSVDSAILDAEKDEAYFSPQFLNTLHPPGMPPHRLLIKKGAIYMLIRTMSVERGLCNGTRFVIHSCDNKFLLVCKHIAGSRKGELFCLPRFLLTPTEKGCAFNFSRRQFPIIPAFAMTINKAQGSTVEELGVDLTSDVFSHGQAYVAYSRVRGWQYLHVLLPEGKFSAKNVVSREVLDMAFHDTSERPASHRPAKPFDSFDPFQKETCQPQHTHSQNAEAKRAQAEADLEFRSEDILDELSADFYDVLDCDDLATTASAGHYEHDSEIQFVRMGLGARSEQQGVAASSVPDKFIIDYKRQYPISESGSLSLLPRSYLNIVETPSANLNCAIASLRALGIAFQCQGGSLKPHRWA